MPNCQLLLSINASDQVKYLFLESLISIDFFSQRIININNIVGIPPKSDSHNWMILWKIVLYPCRLKSLCWKNNNNNKGKQRKKLLRDVYQFVTWRQKSFPDFILFYLLFIPHNDKGFYWEYWKGAGKMDSFCTRSKMNPFMCSIYYGFPFISRENIARSVFTCCFYCFYELFLKNLYLFLKISKVCFKNDFKKCGEPRFFLVNIFVHPKFCT